MICEETRIAREWVQFDNSKLRESVRSRLDAFDGLCYRASTEQNRRHYIRMKMRWRSRNDLFWLTSQLGESFSEIVKYPGFYEPFCDEVSLMNQKLVFHNLHRPSMEFLQGKALALTEMLLPDEVADKEEMTRLQRLYLCFRTFWKSSIITKLHTLQMILNFPNLHVVLCHNKQETSSDNLESIKNLLRISPLKVWFPELVPQSKDWGNKSGFSVDNRSDMGRSEETVMAVGVNTEITGPHWQIAKKNDLVTEDSVTTEEQISKTQEWDARFNTGNFDSPDMPIQDYEGTRYHFADLYSKLKGNPNLKLIEIPIQDKEGHPTVSSRLSRDSIKKIRSNTTSWTFSCQHLLKPEDPEKARFKKEFIFYWDKIPDGTKFVLLVDPASERKKRNDYTAMLVVGMCGSKRFLKYGIRDKLSPTQRIQKAIELIGDHGVKDVLWEAIGFQTTDCFYLEERRRRDHLHFTVHEIKSQTVSKNDRIFSLIPQYEEGNWFWPEKGCVIEKGIFDGRNYDLTEELEREALQFPNCEHDDLLDAMTFIDRADISTGQEKILEVKGPPTMGDYVAMCERNRFNRAQSQQDLRRLVVNYA